MFERLVLCEYAVADLTAANANVFYELGVRHATRQWSTVCLFAEGGRLPFDVVMLRALPYKLSDDGLPMQAEADRAALSAFLHEAKNAVRDGAATDSPLYQLLQGYPRVTYTSTEAFREQVRCADEWRVRNCARSARTAKCTTSTRRTRSRRVKSPRAPGSRSPPPESR